MFDGVLDRNERVVIRGRKKPKASVVEAFAGMTHEFGGGV
jgi:hypothetical protein